MGQGSVNIKGTLDGLTIIMNKEDDFNSILSQIEAKILSAQKFFKGASFNVKYRGKKLSREEEGMVFDLMSTKSGAEIKSFTYEEKEYEPDYRASEAKNQKSRVVASSCDNIEEGETKFYRGTVRSGQLIQSEGNVVIIGDVNPGGEVVAAGNVVVMGSLRGIVHAGSSGNKSAIVVALNLQPMQLRIADIITRSPDEKVTRGDYIPELAFVKDDMVYIDRYLPQYK